MTLPKSDLIQGQLVTLIESQVQDLVAKLEHLLGFDLLSTFFNCRFIGQRSREMKQRDDFRLYLFQIFRNFARSNFADKH